LPRSCRCKYGRSCFCERYYCCFRACELHGFFWAAADNGRPPPLEVFEGGQPGSAAEENAEADKALDQRVRGVVRFRLCTVDVNTVVDVSQALDVLRYLR
jgi:hypothetical protein